MTTKEVSDKTGLGISTVLKYAEILGIEYLGTGRRKVYNWQEKQIKLLAKSIQKRGRKPKKP